MKFTKFGKALLMSALSAGIILGVSSCVQSYTVGFLYVTGTVTSGTGEDGIISGFKIDHNTGKLTAINGLPVSSGGANPDRAILTASSRFLYVLNRGASADGQPCSTTDPCLHSNITQFSVGGNGILTPQETFTTQGINPFRMFADAPGDFLYVLDHDAPSNLYCSAAILNATSCGDITVFQINSTTGRLSLVTNALVSSNVGSPITYFPVPANPVDFVLTSNYVLTLSGTASTPYPYSGGSTVEAYSYSPATGELTAPIVSAILGVNAGTAIDSVGGDIYVLDNSNALVGTSAGAVSELLPFTCCTTGGALQAQTSGAVADDPTVSDPILAMIESKGKFLYILNDGGNPADPTNNPTGGIAGFVINSPFQLTLTAPSYFGTGPAPQCIVEDPSNQFIYTANNDSTVTMRIVDPNSGDLDISTHAANSVPLTGPATWCITDGRTD